MSESGGVAYVGSSNISQLALTAGTEWNLRVRRRVDPHAFAEVQSAFEAQWARSAPLTADWIDDYQLRVQEAPDRPPLGDPEVDSAEAPAEPHEVQKEALDALRRARLQGRRRARFVRQWLGDKGLRVAAIFSDKDSDDRDASLTALRDGDLDAVCAVDILNEGVDIPTVDRVVMLRPTESPVVFMQQLGRGLRRAQGKDSLTVLDFVGNHRVFLDRVRTLLSLGSSDAKALSLREFLVKGELPELPPGCKIDVDLEAIELLHDLLPTSSRSGFIREYRELREARGARPRIVELYRLGLKLSTLRSTYGGWFGFLADEGDLTDAELEAWQLGKDTIAVSHSLRAMVG